MIDDHHLKISGPRRSERLLLRPPKVEDLLFLTDLFTKPELVAHRPNPRPDSPEESAARLAKDMAHWQEHGFGRWAVSAGETPIGFGGVTVSQTFDGLNISYHLTPESWGHGYATELVRDIVSFAFEDLRAHRLIGLVREANPASRRVLEKAGFQFEAEVQLHGAPTNLLSLER